MKADEWPRLVLVLNGAGRAQGAGHSGGGQSAGKGEAGQISGIDGGGQSAGNGGVSALKVVHSWVVTPLAAYETLVCCSRILHVNVQILSFCVFKVEI